MEKETIESLLKQVSTIIQLHEKMAELNGENFNVFNILGLSTLEVRTHSAFLAQLLNPKGSHGQKDTFLKLFVEQIHFPEFICESARVEVERHIGVISENGTKGGNIDIIVTDKNNRLIIIENKIYAGDQVHQLLRYYNYGIMNNQPFRLLYLTPDGKEASNDSICNLKVDKDYFLISYSKDILDWLKKCKEKSVDHAILRETITQYIHLIQQITNQTTIHIMKEEIVKTIISNDENIKALFEIQKDNVKNDVKKEIIKKFRNQMIELEQEMTLKMEFEDIFGFSNEDTYITFYLNNSKKGFYIQFGFCGSASNMFYKVHCETEFVDVCRDEICSRLGYRINGFNGDIWVNWMDNEFRNWDDSAEPWLAILNGEMKQNFKEKIQHILKCLEGFEL